MGLNEMGVALVQQMFGRAGRIGAGETDGWAFLIVDENERSTWQGRLVAGDSVASQIAESLPDHVLAEMVQGRISALGEAESGGSRHWRITRVTRTRVDCMRHSICWSMASTSSRRVSGLGRRHRGHRPGRADSEADGFGGSGACPAYCLARRAPAIRA